MLAATSSFINCVNGINGDTPTEITRPDCDEVIRTLMNNNTYSIMDNIEGANKYGTAPIRKAYFCLCSTELVGNLDQVFGFKAVAEYPSPNNILDSEYGAISNLRFLVSSIGSFVPKASVNMADIFNIFCVGMEAYACVEQDGYSAQFIYRPPIYDGPLALNASVGYKFAEVPRITNDLWIINLRATLAL
jgi:N4-gp56 family major capsid protein